jgi:hypothetical protein
LIEQLAVAVSVLDQTEGFFIVHFVLFDLLYFVLLVLVQYVPSEVGLVVLEYLSALSIVEVGRHELVEVLHVHELGIDLFKHLLVESLLQDVFVLFAQPYCSGVHGAQGDAVGEFYQSSVLPVRLEYLQVVALEEDNVGQVELQRPCAAQAQPI